MNLSSAKTKVKKAFESIKFAKEHNLLYYNYPLIEFNKIKYSGKLSGEDLEKFEIWFSKLVYQNP